MQSPPMTDTPSAASRWQLAGALLVAAVCAWLWGSVILPEYNSEMRGDLVHHVFMVQEFTEADEVRTNFLPGYPRTSHQLTAWLLGVFGDEPFRAVRAVSFGSILVFMVLQFALLRQVLPSAWALAVLLFWQWLAHQTKTGNHHFYHAAFFYAQGVGSIGVWAALLLLVRENQTGGGRLLQTGCAGAAAGFAYSCHLAPGLAAWAAVGWLTLDRALRQPTRDRLLGVLSVMLLAGVSVLTSEQFRYMSSVRGVDGTIDVNRPVLFLLWVPTLPWALWDQWRSRREANSAGREVRVVLTALLLSAGLIQACLAWGWLVQGTVAPYSVKKMGFYTFPAAALWWLVQLTCALRRRLSTPGWLALRWQRYPLGRMLLGLACVLFLAQNTRSYMWRTEFQKPWLERDETPLRVCAHLDQWPAAKASAVFLDPRAANAAYFVNHAGLGWSVADCECCGAVMVGKKSAEQLAEITGVQHIVTPGAVEAQSLFGIAVEHGWLGPLKYYALGTVLQARRAARLQSMDSGPRIAP